MNEQIFKLALKAMDFQGAVNIDTELKLTNSELAKFAELIVRECMSVADLPNNASGQWDHLLPSEVIGKHFGVEQ